MRKTEREKEREKKREKKRKKEKKERKKTPASLARAVPSLVLCPLTTTPLT